MGTREQDLEGIGAIYATFSVHQSSGVDDLKDADVETAVKLTGDFEIGPVTDGSVVLGKLVDLSLTDADSGKRAATVQIGGVMVLPITTTYPVVGDRIVGGANGAVKKAPALTGYDPAGGNIARGTVISVNGTTDCTLILN